MVRTDRRQGRRQRISKPAKLRCLTTGKYMVGRTRDISTCGALMEVDRPSLLINGQRLAIGVAWSSDQPLLHAQQMIQATVIRSLGLGPIQHVAIQFDHPQAMPGAGLESNQTLDPTNAITAVC